MGDWHPAPRGAKARLERTFESMAERTGLEPATSGVTGQHSNQLNYRSALYCCFAPRRGNEDGEKVALTLQGEKPRASAGSS